MSRGRRLAVMTLASLLLAAVFVTAAQAAAPRASLAEIEPQVMCVTCKIPLNVAVSPQANRERAFIQSLIDEGKDESQIKREMVAQYGSAVLALPAAHGFDLTVYLVPLAAVLLLAGTWLVLLPRWRRRAREQAAKRIAVQPLAPTDAARLDSDLARFD